MTADTEELDKRLLKAAKWWHEASGSERAAMIAAQSKSWVRAFQPCEHGERDFEQCAECRGTTP